MSETEPAIRIESLCKTYAAKGVEPKRALDDVSFDVPRGQIFGLLGPNGAGKSTLINILAGLVTKSAGSVSIWGFDIDKHPRNSKRAIGVVPQEIIFDPFFTPRETLEIQAGLYGIPAGERMSDELLAAMHLTDKANAYSRTLSGGMKRRLLVAKAMTHSPPILVLDEPTAGVDVELRRQLWDYVRKLHAQGVTIVLTTHYLEEADRLADRLAIVDRGRIVAEGEPETLKGELFGDAVQVEFDGTAPESLVRTALASLTGLREILVDPHHVRARVDHGATAVPSMLAALEAGGVKVASVRVARPSLDDVYLRYAGRSFSEADQGAPR